MQVAIELLNLQLRLRILLARVLIPVVVQGESKMRFLEEDAETLWTKGYLPFLRGSQLHYFHKEKMHTCRKGKAMQLLVLLGAIFDLDEFAELCLLAFRWSPGH